MALVECNECGNQVSDKAITCPHCGVQFTSSEGVKIANGVGWVLLIGIVLLVLLSFVEL